MFWKIDIPENLENRKRLIKILSKIPEKYLQRWSKGKVIIRKNIVFLLKYEFVLCYVFDQKFKHNLWKPYGTRCH